MFVGQRGWGETPLGRFGSLQVKTGEERKQQVKLTVSILSLLS